MSPSFHGYWKSIQSAFTDLGYDVGTHCYDAAPRSEKLWNKVRHELPAKLRGKQQHLSSEVVTARAMAALRGARPDIVLIIRGDVLGLEFWDEIRIIGATPALWLYDEIRRMKYSLETVGRLAPIASYSRGDVKALREHGVDALHVPNAYDPSIVPSSAGRTDEFTFIGARYGRREELMRALVDAGLPVRAYGREWSGHLVDRARTWRLRGAPVPAARDIPLAVSYGVMKSSLATLNVHANQDGFTMRTFEAPGAGAVQIIDREDVEEYYEPGKEVLVFTDVESLVRQARDVMTSTNRMAELREAGHRRTLADHTFRHRVTALAKLWA